MPHADREWMPFTDLMSGVVAVIILLFVFATVQKALDRIALENEVAAEKEARAKLERQRGQLAEKFKELEKRIEGNGALAKLVSVDPEKTMLTLEDATFATGDACLRYRDTLSEVSVIFRDFLANLPSAGVQIEGHTDSSRVWLKRPDPLSPCPPRRECGEFDDNFSLSALRAREARKALTAGWDDSLQQRVWIAGYADTRPRQGLDSKDPRNRRVAIRLVEDVKTIAPSLTDAPPPPTK